MCASSDSDRLEVLKNIAAEKIFVLNQFLKNCFRPNIFSAQKFFQEIDRINAISVEIVRRKIEAVKCPLEELWLVPWQVLQLEPAIQKSSLRLPRGRAE